MQTKGEYRVGISFNPSQDDAVSRIKRAAADLIDMIDSIPSDRDSERGNEAGRLKALAQTAIEDGAMWAVKAATKPERK
ncbi:Acb2/Tad1 domain-containing protein [Paracoccus versutus]